MKVLIASKTAAETTASRIIHEGQGYDYPAFPVTLWTWSIAGTETIDIQFPTDAGGWETMETLDADQKHVSIYAPLEFRLVKSVTAGACGVAMSDVRGL